MSPLAPTVIGPLSECSSTVRVQNQLIGSTVDLLVNGSLTVNGTKVGGGVATWPDQEFALNKNAGVTLRAADTVTATQTLGGQTSPPSAMPSVIVQKRPASIGGVHYAGHQYACGHCLVVAGAVPGASVTVSQGGTQLGTAQAPDGTARVHLNAPIAAGQALSALQTACGQPGTPTPSPVPDAPPEKLTAPVIGTPLQACEEGVSVSGVYEGARVTLQRTAAGASTSTSSCFDLSALIFQVSPLKSGESVSVQQAFPGCRVAPSPPAATVVGPVQPVPAPTVVPPLCAGTTSVRVTGLKPGALITILAGGVALGQAQAFQTTADLDVPPLIGGKPVTARQELCNNTSGDSNHVPVDPLPGALPQPSIAAPLFECASVVRVLNVHPGADVFVYSTALAAPIGYQHAYATSADIHVAPLLAPGDTIYAVQIGCGQTSDESPGVPVQRLAGVNPPTVRTPLTECTRTVRVDGVVPGATVDLYVNGVFRGTADSPTSSATVAVTGALHVGDAVTARQRICTIVTADGPPAKVAFGPAVVTTHHNDNLRTGANLLEVQLTPANVGSGRFGLLFSRVVDGQVYAQPLYLCHQTISGVGERNVVYVATMHNTVYAFDADDPDATAPLWQTSLGPSAQPPHDAIGGGHGYRDISGPPGPDGVVPQAEIGVLSTPAISPDRNAIYVLAFTKDPGTTDKAGCHHTLHALDLGTGQEILGGPVPIVATVPGTGEGGKQINFTSYLQGQRPALTLVHDRLYAAFASYGDNTPYHGWVIGFDANNLNQTGVFNTTPDFGQGGIWQAGQGLAADNDGFLYCLTGNGPYPDANWRAPDGRSLHESIVKLTSDLAVSDWFAPHDARALDSGDVDLGSGGPLLIPGTTLLVGGGKNGIYYLVNTANMGHFAADLPGANPLVPTLNVSTSEIHGGPVYWNFPNGPLVYVWPMDDRLRAYRVAAGQLQPNPVSTGPETAPDPGGFLSVSANGTDPASGILWASHPTQSAGQAAAPGILRAYRAIDVSKEIWNSTMNGPRDAVGLFAKNCPPTIANGKVYLATFSNRLMVYGLLG